MFQGLEGCEAEFPDPQRCASSPFTGIVALSFRHPTDSWAFGLDAGAGVHVEDEAFGGSAQLVRFGGAMERSLNTGWVAEGRPVVGRALNDVWEERLGESLQAHPGRGGRAAPLAQVNLP